MISSCMTLFLLMFNDNFGQTLCKLSRLEFCMMIDATYMITADVCTYMCICIYAHVFALRITYVPVTLPTI